MKKSKAEIMNEKKFVDVKANKLDKGTYQALVDNGTIVIVDNGKINKRLKRYTLEEAKKLKIKIKIKK
jgi:hypothetical protein